MSPDKIGLGSPGFFCSVPPKPPASLASKSLLESRGVKARVTLDLDLGSSWPPGPGDGGLDLRKERPSCVAWRAVSFWAASQGAVGWLCLRPWFRSPAICLPQPAVLPVGPASAFVQE